MGTYSRIFGAWTDDGYLTPILRSENSEELEATDLQYWVSESHQVKRWNLTWPDDPNLVQPDIAIISLKFGVLLSPRAIGLIDETRVGDVDLLSVRVDSVEWRLTKPSKLVPALPSYFDFDSIVRESGEIDIFWVRWFNLLKSDVGCSEIFRLNEQSKGRVYFTESLVQRYFSLKLTGLRFEHVGYIVDKPEDAVPPPPRPVPRIEQAPRWPQWEEAPEEEIARFAQAGETFLQTKGLSASSEPSAVLAALAAEIEAHRHGYGKLKPKVRKELLSGLAGAFGLLLRHQAHWNWVDLPVTSRAWDLGLKSPNGSHALCLNQVMVRQLTSPEPSTIVLLFNMIAAGNLPDGQPGDHVAIG